MSKQNSITISELDFSLYGKNAKNVKTILLALEKIIDECPMKPTKEQLKHNHEWKKISIEGFIFEMCDCGISKDELTDPHQCNEKCTPLKYAIQTYGLENVVFSSKRAFTNIGTNCEFALVFDGNGLYDYLSNNAEYLIFERIYEQWNELLNGLKLNDEHYHSWNLCFYKQ